MRRLAVVLPLLVAALTWVVPPAVGQTPDPPLPTAEPTPAPDPIADPSPAPSPGPAPAGEGGSGGASDGGSGGSSGSASIPSVSTAPSSGGGSSVEPSAPQASTKPTPKREKPAVEPSPPATAAHEPRDPPLTQAARAIGLLVAQPKGSARPLQLILGLAAALALTLMLLAVLPPRMLTGVSAGLAEQRRNVELALAAVVWSLVMGLLAASCAAQLG